MGRLKLIAAASALMNLLYFTICIGYGLTFIKLMNKNISGTDWQVIKIIITYLLAGMVLNGILVLLPFCVGMKVRSTTASLMSSFIMIFVLQLIISQSENAAFELVITLVLTGMMLLTFYILRKSRVIHILPN